MAKNTDFISIHIGEFMFAHFEQFYFSTFFTKNIKNIQNLFQIVPKGPQTIPKHVQQNPKSVQQVSEKCPTSVQKVSENCPKSVQKVSLLQVQYLVEGKHR
jgi:hypothetical protein